MTEDWRRIEIIDLIERLRAKPEKGFEISPLMLDAAYEIERLMWDRDQWKQAALDHRSECKRWQEENKILFETLDEIVRLRRALDHIIAEMEYESGNGDIALRVAKQAKEGK